MMNFIPFKNSMKSAARSPPANITSYSEFNNYFQSFRSSDLTLLDQTFSCKYSARDEYFDAKPTHSLITLQIVPNSSNGEEKVEEKDEELSVWRFRVEKYIQNSRKFKNNIPLMKCFKEVTDGGSTFTLHLCAFPFDPNTQSEMHNMKMEKELVHRKKDLITLEKYLESNYSLVNDYGLIMGILHDISRSIFELHTMTKLTHNSIIPRNIVISKSRSTALIGLPSFGLDDVVGTLNDEHLTYFSPQVLERFERGEESVFTIGNDMYMLGTLIIRLLLGEEFDAKYLDHDMIDKELIELKLKILSRLNNKTELVTSCGKILDMAFRCINADESKRPTIAEMIQLFDKPQAEIVSPVMRQFSPRSSPNSAIVANRVANLSSTTTTTTTSGSSIFGIKKNKKEGVPFDYSNFSLDICNSIDSPQIYSPPKKVMDEMEKVCDDYIECEVESKDQSPEDLNEEKKNLYIIDKRISEGASAVVFTLKKPSECVMKRYKKGHESDYQREIRCLQQRHHNIVNLIDNYCFKEGDNFNHVIIMEYCGYGDLYRLVSSTVQKTAIKPIKFLTMGIQLFEALCHLHSNEYVHCDVKPQNVFLQKDGTVKLGDFAFSVKNGETSPGLTFHYAPPELHEGKPAIIECDVYSAACSLFEVLVKKKVGLKDKDFTQVWDQHNSNSRYYSRSLSNPHAISLFNLFNECLQVDVKNRCSSKKALAELIRIRNEYCTTLIQKVFRGFRVRKSLKKLK